MEKIDFRRYHQLEEYLFNEVSQKFHKNGCIDLFDFMCIIIWKSNRSKTKIFNKLKQKDNDLERTITNLTNCIFKAVSEPGKLNVLLNHDFNLPIATAILSVFYPNTFTVYDVRVREQIGIDDVFSKNPDVIWKHYDDYRNMVIQNVPHLELLREKDRFLWGKSFYDELKKDLKDDFQRLKK